VPTVRRDNTKNPEVLSFIAGTVYFHKDNPGEIFWFCSDVYVNGRCVHRHLKKKAPYFHISHVLVGKILSWGPESNAHSHGHRAALHLGKRMLSTLPLTFRHLASCILGQAFRYSPENAFYIFNQQTYFII